MGGDFPMTSSSPWRVRLSLPTFPDLDYSELAELLNSGWLSNAGEVQNFERDFAQYLGGGQAVAMSSCSAALHLALLAHGIGHGDEVITTPMTFVATVNAVVHVGATPVLVDVEPGTLNIDPDCLAAAITPQTRAVIVVHFAGHPVNLERISELKRQHGFVLIQDAAHATEAQIGGKSVALYGDTSCFSFYATKNLPLGEGGMLVTLDPDVAGTARQLRMHGMSRGALQRHGDAQERWQHWEMVRPGFNYKMAEIAGYLGQHQLRRIDDWLERRSALVGRYRSNLASLKGIRLLGEQQGIRHAHHIFVILLDRSDLERDLFLPRLRDEGIECSVHYRAIHELDWYRRTYGWSEEQLPVASHASRNCISLPLHPLMDDAQVDLVTDAIKQLLG